MGKPYGSGTNLVSPNDQLGRLAFLDALPPDVLAQLQALPWHFEETIQVDDDGSTVGSLQPANKQFVLDRLNASEAVTVTDGGSVTVTTQQLSAQTLVLEGPVVAGAVVVLPNAGQWFVINRCTGTGDVTLRGTVTLQQVVLQVGENAAIYVDNQGVSALATSSASFINYYPFTAAAGQTEFDFSYTPGLVFGFSGGQAYLPSVDFDATSGSKIVLKQAATQGSVWTFVAFTVTCIANAVPLSGGTMQGPLQLTTGSTAPTPAVGTNDDSLATMAAIFMSKRVQAEVIDVSTTSYSLKADSIGATLNLKSTADSVVTLPDLTSVFPMGWFDLINTSATGTASLVGDSSFNLIDPYTGQAATTYVLGPGESVRIIANITAGFWQVGVGLAKTQGRTLAVKTFLGAGIFTYTRTPGTRLIQVYGMGGGAASAGLPACATGYVAVAQSGSPGARAFAMYQAGFDTAIVTVGAGGASVAANDSGQNGEDGGTSSFGSLLTLPGGKGGTFAMTNSASGISAYAGTSAAAPSGTGILGSSYGIVAPVAFINTAGMFGGIDCNGQGLEGTNNGLGGMGQYTNTAAATDSTPTNAGNDGGFLIYEMT